MVRFIGYTKLNISTNKPYETLLYSITTHTVEKIMEMNGWTEDVAKEMLETRTAGMDNFTSLYHKANADQKLRDRYEYLMSVKLDENSRLRAAEDRGRNEGLAEGRSEGLAKGRAEGRSEGLAEGRSEGEKKAKMEMAKNFYQMGLSIEQIAQGVKYPVEVIKQWLGLAAAQN